MRKRKDSNRTRYFPGDKRPGKYISKDKMSSLTGGLNMPGLF